MIKRYCGYRDGGDLIVKVVTPTVASELLDQSLEWGEAIGEERSLSARLDLCNCSSFSGFECGYGGSGPAQLALAILADYFGDDDRALDLYQRFKNEVISGLSRQGWTLTSSQIEEAVKKIERPRSIQSMLADIVAAKAAVKMLENRLDAGGDWSNDWDNALRPEIQAIQECLERMKKELE